MPAPQPSEPELGTGPFTLGPENAAVGRYRLLQPLGEGGFGIVYLAEQREPVRQVAVKIIKPGMDSAQVVARFEQERQALALMDHPNIAKVLDGGRTEQGRPYFVMELVKGVPITRFCDEQKLTPRQRLELFIPVCQAIQHAHQKGIIHRDIKPSNVLVTLQDGKAVPKVIDFGVAKALHQRLTDHTMFTAIGAVVGTPEYMSPEQAGVNPLDIDTRSDIYSLGVLLYELLTGVTPLDRKRLKQSAPDEVLRLIREEEPLRPSTRISTIEELVTIAARRQVEPRQLAPLLRGELDWIVMKALDKDRNRRYETANGFAMDIGRYLHDEPVLAGPPAASYRLRKFLKRNRGPVLAGGLVVLALVAGIIGMTVGLIRAARAEQRASAERDRAEANFHQARRAVDEYFTQVSEDTLLKSPLPGLQPLRKKLLETALKYYQQFAEKHADDPVLRAELAAAYYRVGDITSEIGSKAEALKAFQQARVIYEELAAADPASAPIRHELARSHRRLGDLLGEMGQPAEAVESYGKAIDLGEALVRDDGATSKYQSELARTYRQLGERRHLMGQPAESVAAYKQAAAIGEKLRDRWPGERRYQGDLGQTYCRTSYLYQHTGQLRQALHAAGEAVAIGQKLVGVSASNSEYQALLARALSEQAFVLRILGPREKAIAPLKRAISIWKALGERNPAVTLYQFELGKCLWSLGNVQCDVDLLPEALESGEKAVSTLKALTAIDSSNDLARSNLAMGHIVIGKVQRKRGQAREALEAFHRGADILTELVPSERIINNYNLACVWSMCSAVVGQFKKELTAEERLKQQQYAEEAMKALRRAIDAGFGSLELNSDPDLEAIRGRADFVKLVEELKSKAAKGK